MIDKKKILVHACCASCSSYVLEHLSSLYEVTAFYYNPNIQPRAEYSLRLGEMREVCSRLGVPLLEGERDASGWEECIGPYIHLGEKSERCWACYRHRLRVTAGAAARLGFALFTTTLSVSPHKVFERISIEGSAAAGIYGIEFLAEDFKKRDGFRLSVEKSRELGLTRQDYCGCVYSRAEAASRRAGRGGGGTT